MKFIKNNFHALLLVLFELAVGILLFIDPEGFTNAVIMIFGGVLAVIGLFKLIRFIAEKRKTGDASYLELILSVLCIILGCVCMFMTSYILNIFAFVAVVYGIILIVSGVFKAASYFDMRSAGLPVSFLSILSAIVSVLLGVVIVFNPFDAVNVLWMFAGISLIVEALLDIAALALIARKK